CPDGGDTTGRSFVQWLRHRFRIGTLSERTVMARRTHTCGDLRPAHVGQTVTLNGWVNVCRAFPQQIFVDLRDRYGLTQVVFESERKDLFAAAQDIGREWVLCVRGTVRPRIPGKENPKLATGAVELEATELTVLNRCPTPPFEVTEFPGDELANEDL